MSPLNFFLRSSSVGQSLWVWWLCWKSMVGKYSWEVWWGSMVVKYGGKVWWESIAATIRIGQEIQCILYAGFGKFQLGLLSFQA